MFDIAMKRFKAWRKSGEIQKILEATRLPPYKIFQNGKGEFSAKELDNGQYISTLGSILAVKNCKTIKECHVAMFDLITDRKAREYKQVYP